MNISELKSDNFFLLAGPCVIEGEEMALNIAEQIMQITSKLNIPYVFKGSYRKANRSRVDSFTGIGDEKALKILRKVHETFGIPVVTDIHEAHEAAMAAQKIIDSGNNNVTLTERGVSFGYGDLVVDFRGIPEMQEFGFPVVLDATHCLQKPNQASGVTGGQPKLIETMCKAGIAVGADGLFIETHPTPSTAKSDGANMLPLDQLEGLLTKLVRIKEAIR